MSCSLSTLSVILMTLAVTKMPAFEAGHAGRASDAEERKVFSLRARSGQDASAGVSGDGRYGSVPTAVQQIALRGALSMKQSQDDSPKKGSAGGNDHGLEFAEGRYKAKALEEGKQTPSSFDSHAPSPGLYHTIWKCAVRSGRELHSKLLAGIPAGHSVYVTQVSGTRAHITKPLDGWVSLKSQEGLELIRPAGSKEVDPALREAEKQLEDLSDNLTATLDSVLDGLRRNDTSSSEKTSNQSTTTTATELQAVSTGDPVAPPRTGSTPTMGAHDHELFPEIFSPADHERLRGFMVPVAASSQNSAEEEEHHKRTLADALQEIQQDWP